MVGNFFYGTEGISKSPDLRIRALEAPDRAVRMAPGGAVVLNRAPRSETEAYFDHSDEEVIIQIDPTGADPRSDLIMVRVEDPWASDGARWNKPSDLKVGPYIFPRIEPNVARSVYSPHVLGKGWSAIPLARIDIPPNTVAIQQSMITDLRSIANGPQRYFEPTAPTTEGKVSQETWTESKPQGVAHTLRYTDRTLFDWPNSANWPVPIPEWANGVDIFTVIENPQQWDGNVWGELTVRVGDHEGTPLEFDMDAIPVPAAWPKAAACVLPNGSTVQQRPNRVPLFYSTTLAFTGQFKDYPGTIKTVKLRARMYNDANTRGRIVADVKTVTYINLHFLRFPIIN